MEQTLLKMNTQLGSRSKRGSSSALRANFLAVLTKQTQDLEPQRQHSISPIQNVIQNTTPYTFCL